MNLIKLKNKAAELRIKTFNAFIEKGEAHLGGSFSMIELLLVLYDLIITKKDKFILSKAHASFPLCILLREKGFKTKIKTHLEIDEKNGINCTTGSLGHGLPISTGMACSLFNCGPSRAPNQCLHIISGRGWDPIPTPTPLVPTGQVSTPKPQFQTLT